MRGAVDPWHHRPMPLSRTLGSITVTALVDGEGPFFQPREQAFPGATAEHWRAADARDPGAVTPDGRRWLPFRWVVDGEARLAPAVRLLPTPGHTPGHQSVPVAAGDERLLVTGDLLVHAVQLVDPELAYAHEMDPATARTSRTTLLRALPGTTTLSTPHLSAAFAPLRAG
ncbi:metallo-beta-lactamase superfamily protein [Micromonospora olivasterospora]|uniref:Metallo-beta-lactamase superfamily protein n=2 Tax=Micromonospora olivasterospora TaxID=1880 RepID=A0A562I6N0_MICOL|nr:metallo-beta-lactamase superfamily protein [Micromonospora olivasterospora]